MALQLARRQGFTLIELLVVIAIISIIAALVMPNISAAREKANILDCSQNLKQVYTFALAYSDKRGSGAFPIGSGKSPRAHESLNELIAFEPEAFVPEMFVCRSSDATPAKADSGGRFLLEPDTLSYGWSAGRLKNTAMHKPLASDKYVRGYEDDEGSHSGHAGMNVLRTDGSVKFIEMSELPPGTMLLQGLTR